MDLKLVQKFEEAFGRPPTHSFRCPGRVNLIGEHVDYSGYAVLPMALEQSIDAVAARRDDGKLNLKNTNPEMYKAYSADTPSMEIDKTSPKWHHYFLCGCRGIVEYLKERSVIVDDNFGLDVLVHGEVPPSAGLSSSSALVCCAALVTLKLATNEDFETISRERLAELCARSERYIGTEGGGMDQAICFLAEAGQAKLIEFNPLRTLSVSVPPGAKFVISNSCVQMNKAASAHFNRRVADCRVAAKILAKKKSVDLAGIRRLCDVQEALSLQLETMTSLVDEELHAEPYTREEACKILSMSDDEFVKECLADNTKDVQEFHCHQRAKHCYSEAYRVYQFATVCKRCSFGKIDQQEALVHLGQLMNASHDSCRDLYECSHPQLDQLVEVARSAGALGSRLTGAGWGGCVVSLVPDDKADGFLKSLKELYYDKLKDAEQKQLAGAAVFVTAPAAGAQVQTLG